jgi:hypothetical protein
MLGEQALKQDIPLALADDDNSPVVTAVCNFV